MIDFGAVGALDAVGYLVGGGAGVAALVAFAKWTVERYFARRDKAHERLEQREARVAAAEKAEREDLKARLTAVEMQLRIVTADLERHRLASFMMATEVHKLDPDNPTLAHMANILGGAIPFPGASEDNAAMADLLDQLRKVD